MVKKITQYVASGLRRELSSNPDRSLNLKNIWIAQALTPLLIQQALEGRDVQHQIPMSASAGSLADEENYLWPNPEQVVSLADAFRMSMRIETRLLNAILPGFQLPSVIVEIRLFAARASQAHFMLQAGIVAGTVVYFKRHESLKRTVRPAIRRVKVPGRGTFTEVH